MKQPALRDVEVGGVIGRRIDATIKGNMLAVDVDNDFLKPFRIESRLARKDRGFVGTGLFLDAAARLARYGKNDELAALRERMIREIVATQEADGYIGIFPPARRFIDAWDINDVGCLIQALASNYRYWGDNDALQAACRLADWLIREWRASPARVPDWCVMATLMIEMGMLDLYEHTGNRAYLDFCIDTTGLRTWNRPIVLGRWGRIDGHVYDYLFRCIAQVKLSKWVPDAQLLAPTRRAVDFMLAGDGMVVTGEVGDHECWHDSQEGTVNLGETCATAYVIRLMHILLQRTEDSRYGDVMERAIYNALFAAQSPEGRRLRYYTAMDGPKAYFHTDTYCCPGNFRRIMGELPEMVCYADPGGVTVNLYAPSTVRFDLPGGGQGTLTQQTDYPNAGEVRMRLELDCPTNFALRLRVPRWCAEAQITVNGEPAADKPRAGTFHVLQRQWRSDDAVVITLPMPLRLVRGRKAQSGRAAIMRGPIVFGLNRQMHPDLATTDLRNVVIDPSTLETLADHDAPATPKTRCRVRAWLPGRWYPFQKSDLELTLTDFTDPGGELVYLKVPVPNDSRLVEDELLGLGDGSRGPDSTYDADTLNKDCGDAADGDLLARLQSGEGSQPQRDDRQGLAARPRAATTA